MDEATAALAATIGARVRRERRARQLTLERLAELSGVSRRMLINVEQGAANPSVGTLLRLGDALGVGLPTLVEPPRPRPFRLVRRGEGATLWTSAAGGSGVLVAGTPSPDVVELWEWTLGPHDGRETEAHSAGTKELVHVRSGTLQVRVAGQSVTLTAGDAVSFPGDEPHAYLNPTADPTSFTMAVFEPGVGSARSEAAHA